MTRFDWISDSQVVATDIDEAGVVTVYTANVKPSGAFEIVKVQTFETGTKVGSLPPEKLEAVGKASLSV